MDKRWKVMHQYAGGEPYFFDCSADAEARADELNREAGYVTET